MIRDLLASLQQKISGPAAPRAVAAAAPQSVRLSNPWHAVCIQPVGKRCAAATALVGQRFLSRDAPRLPLADCDQPACQCHYRHYDDRRTEGQALDRNGMPLPHPERRDSD
jgi:hypothetical protein